MPGVASITTNESNGRSTYSTASSLLVAALAGDLESDIVGRVALDLNGAGREVVEVLVQQLYAPWLALFDLFASFARQEQKVRAAGNFILRLGKLMAEEGGSSRCTKKH